MMRERLLKVAEELLIRHGYHSVSFRDVAEIVQTTRANMHYHFGSKNGLVEAVLEDYNKRTIQQYQTIWSSAATTLEDKLVQTVSLMRERYKYYNPGDQRGKPWSLTTRLYNDWDALTPKMQASLQHTINEFESLVRIGVALGVHSGELRENAPQEDICLQLSTIILFAAHLTGDEHRAFDHLAHLWDATWNMILQAYGPAGASPAYRKISALAAAADQPANSSGQKRDKPRLGQPTAN